MRHSATHYIEQLRDIDPHTALALRREYTPAGVTMARNDIVWLAYNGRISRSDATRARRILAAIACRLPPADVAAYVVGRGVRACYVCIRCVRPGSGDPVYHGDPLAIGDECDWCGLAF